jgi:predicted RNA-binding protein with PUA-like domain
MTTQYWLVKQEPDSYAWQDFVRDRRTTWDGVRNYQARNHLKSMRRGDCVFFYASGALKEIQGTARVSREAFADPTDETGDWVTVELEADEPLVQPVTLAAIKAEPALENMALVRHSRLSVMPLRRTEYDLILRMSKPKPDRRPSAARAKS